MVQAKPYREVASRVATTCREYVVNIGGNERLRLLLLLRQDNKEVDSEDVGADEEDSASITIDGSAVAIKKIERMIVGGWPRL